MISQFKKSLLLGLTVLFLSSINVAQAVSPYQACLDRGQLPTQCQGLSTVDSSGTNNFTITKPDQVITNIPGLIGFAVQILFIVAGLVAFVYLLLGGIKWITSGGDKGQVEAARNQIIQALIGLVVVFAAWGLIVLVQNLFGLCLGFGCTLSLPGPDTLRN